MGNHLLFENNEKRSVFNIIHFFSDLKSKNNSSCFSTHIYWDKLIVLARYERNKIYRLKRENDRFSHDLNILFWACVKYEYINKVHSMRITLQRERMKTYWQYKIDWIWWAGSSNYCRHIIKLKWDKKWEIKPMKKIERLLPCYVAYLGIFERWKTSCYISSLLSLKNNFNVYWTSSYSWENSISFGILLWPLHWMTVL